MADELTLGCDVVIFTGIPQLDMTNMSGVLWTDEHTFQHCR